jgi:hypothetical protein
MARGAVYYHSQFKFHDGQIGQKRLVVLNEPINDEPFLIVKTTSNLRSNKYIIGCNPNKGVFFLPANQVSIFELDTVIQLLEIYETTPQEFLHAHLQEKTLTQLGQLSTLCISQIVNCIRKLKDDIRQDYFSLITR